jgi:MFS family permease
MPDTAEQPPPSSPLPTAWSPMRYPVFRMLWLTWLTSNICMWMNDVAAAWLMTTLTPSPVMVALVQSASTLPVFLLGFPSGALADILDRRLWFVATQFWIAAVAVTLCVVQFGGWMNAQLLLVLTFANGIGMALRWPVYAAIVPTLLPRQELSSAVALNGVAMNTSRVVGPMAAGALIAGAGSGYVFLLNAVLSLVAAALILRWRSEQKVSVLPGERFFGAMRAGFQYVSQSPPLRHVLLRVALFFLQSGALLALLPLVAKRIEGGAWGFTVLLASLGAGAVTAALWLPRLRVLVTRDRLIRDGSVIQAAAMIGVAFAPNVWSAIPGMLVAGAAWISTVNTMTVYSQLSLPDWVRARGMALYMSTMMGSASVSAALWGQVASFADVPIALLAAAATGMLGLVLTRRISLAREEEAGLTPARILKEPTPAYPIEHDKGPVMVTIEYRIDPARTEEFLAVMRESRVNQLKRGALSWGLFHSITDPDVYVEYFLDESWADHLRRFDRYTAADAELRERRMAFHVGPAPARISRYVAESLVR